MIQDFRGKTPKIAANVYIAPTAVIIGNVEINEGASVWFNSVIRGDEEKIVIGAGSNIQDNCTLHADPDFPVIIGSRVTVGHNAVVHGCTIEDDVLIGMHATILNRCVIHTGSVVAAGALIKEGQHIGPYQLAAGMPAVVKKEMGGVVLPEIKLSAEAYIELSRHYLHTSSKA